MHFTNKIRRPIAMSVSALWLVAATLAYAGQGDILKQIVSLALAAQRAALANQAQANHALQALRTATQSYQANGIRGGGVMLNISNNPSAVPSQILASFQADGKVYVIDRNGIIFGGPRQINTHELTGAAMGATSNTITELRWSPNHPTK